MKGAIYLQNQDIKNAIHKANLYQWQVAQKIGVSEMTLIRWLRTQIDSSKKQQIFSAIEELRKEVL
jgi:hypothetical protein